MKITGCEECDRLDSERTDRYLEYLAARDALKQTQKSDSAHSQRSRELKEATGRLDEAVKRQAFHEENHAENSK